MTERMRMILARLAQGWECHEASSSGPAGYCVMRKRGETAERVSYATVRKLAARGMVREVQRRPIRKWAITEVGHRARG